MIEMTMIILMRMKIKCLYSYHDTIPYPRGVSWSLFLVRMRLILFNLKLQKFLVQGLRVPQKKLVLT